MGFDNDLFDPTDADGLAAVFFGGITTDLGDLTVEVSAIDLVMTDGDSIVSAIFDELVSLAPSFGAQVVNQGRFLDFIFDPLLTQDGAGVFFGTTSLSEGAFGTVELFTSAPEPTTLTLLGLGLLGVGYCEAAKIAVVLLEATASTDPAQRVGFLLSAPGPGCVKSPEQISKRALTAKSDKVCGEQGAEMGVRAPFEQLFLREFSIPDFSHTLGQ